MCLYYCIFLHHEAEKTKQTNWTQMLNKKSTNTPLLWLIFAFALTLKRVFSKFLEVQLCNTVVKAYWCSFFCIWVQFGDKLLFFTYYTWPHCVNYVQDFAGTITHNQAHGNLICKGKNTADYDVCYVSKFWWFVFIWAGWSGSILQFR